MKVGYSLFDFTEKRFSTYENGADESLWDFYLQDMRDSVYMKDEIESDMLGMIPLDKVKLDMEYDTKNIHEDIVSIAREGLKDINFKEILMKYDIGFDYENGLSYSTPKYYNFLNDVLNLEFVFIDIDPHDYMEKHGLTTLVQYYIDKVRVKSYDGYMSFEPDRLDKVELYDFCILRAVMKSENLLEDLNSVVEDIAEQYYDILIDNTTPIYEVREKDEAGETHFYQHHLRYDEGRLVGIVKS